MGEKFWIQDFDSGLDRLRIHFASERGRVTSIIVIQYEAFIGGRWHPIVRFDEAHGFFHRDVMRFDGGQEKTPLPAIDKNLALSQAIQHIKQFWAWFIFNKTSFTNLSLVAAISNRVLDNAIGNRGYQL